MGYSSTTEIGGASLPQAIATSCPSVHERLARRQEDTLRKVWNKFLREHQAETKELATVSSLSARGLPTTLPMWAIKVIRANMYKHPQTLGIGTPKDLQTPEAKKPIKHIVDSIKLPLELVSIFIQATRPEIDSRTKKHRFSTTNFTLASDMTQEPYVQQDSIHLTQAHTRITVERAAPLANDAVNVPWPRLQRPNPKVET